jgi:hypothetical protein
MVQSSLSHLTIGVNMVNKFKLSLAVTIIWMIVIFMLSDQPSQQSNDLSKGVTGMITGCTEYVIII